MPDIGSELVLANPTYMKVVLVIKPSEFIGTPPERNVSRGLGVIILEGQ